MRTCGHFYMSFITMYHQYAKFGFMHAFEPKNVICKSIMLCMQVCYVMICKLPCYVCKFGLIISLMLSCYASLSWVYEPKASSFMLKVAFWQHVGYHISYDNLHVRLNANLWPFLHVIYHHVSPIC